MNPKVSIAIPIHQTPKTAFFLSRLFKSISEQTFTNYEVILTNEPGMAHNHNAAILKSKGELIKLMQMDDYFDSPYSLKDIVDNFGTEDYWQVTACTHTLDGITTFNPHYPSWTEDIITGNNRLGSLSTITIRNQGKILMGEPLTWVVDCDWYWI